LNDAAPCCHAIFYIPAIIISELMRQTRAMLTGAPKMPALMLARKTANMPHLLILKKNQPRERRENEPRAIRACVRYATPVDHH